MDLSTLSDSSQIVNITPVSSSYKVGDILTCSADGNPPPIYQWRNLQTHEIVNGSKLTLNLETSDTVWFQCVTYTQDSESYVMATKNISFEVKSNNGIKFLSFAIIII